MHPHKRVLSAGALCVLSCQALEQLLQLLQKLEHASWVDWARA